MLSVLIGALLPFVLSIVIRSHWDSDVKATIAFLACVPAGIASAYVGGVLTFGDAQQVTTDVLLVMTASYAFYNGFYKHNIDTLRSIKLPFSIQSPFVSSKPAESTAPVEPANGNP